MPGLFFGLFFLADLPRDPWAEPETVQSIILTLGVCTTALAGVAVALIARTRSHAKTAVSHAKTAADQVQNSHSSNLRDDLDDKFEGLADLVKGLAKDVGGMRSDIRLIRSEAAADRAALATERERIRDIENTMPTHPKHSKE